VANELVRWTVEEHPVVQLRDAFYPQNIIATEPDDPQQNPPADQTRVHIHYTPGQKVTPDQELEIVVKNLRSFLKEYPDRTVALLVPENSRGFKLAQALKEEGLPYEELLRSTTGARTAAAYLATVLEYAASPYDSGLLARLYRDVWAVLFPTDPTEASEVHQFLVGLRFVESVVWDADSALMESRSLADFLGFVRMVLSGLSLPVDQLVLTVSQRLFSDAVDVALAYKVSSLLRSFAGLNAGWRLGDFVRELRVVVDNQRRFLGFDDAADGYVPRAGLPTIATFHAAKGLEWDRVYLMAVSNYGFPSVQVFDDYVGERWFLASGLNLDEEVVAQVDSIINRVGGLFGDASVLGRVSYASERLRLLYVGLTRAESDLVITWNVGRFAVGGQENVLAMGVESLLGFVGVN
jgi:DNA helicase-2/ATP-dependent DNA helicase PcrA